MFMRIVLTPLEEQYQTIALRVTELESYFTCPFKHKFWKQDFANNEALHFGSLTHAVLQAFFFKPKAGIDTLDIICRSYEDRCKIIYNYLKLAEDNKLSEQYNLICTEFKCVIEIEMWKFLIILEGTIDVISRDDQGNYTLIDFKTSKAEWKPEQYENKIQKFLYPWLLAQLVGEEHVKAFDYLIFTKHVTPRLQQLKYVVDWNETNLFLKTLLTNYCFSFENSMWNPKICQVCFFCPLKATCPLKAEAQSDNF